ncbi:polyprenyl synthetase family protein [Candidatus Woesearchaeota archaeon]|nr:polyprenyl synthetase family protein [Candidatus Woesearchaeota archaeon]
MNFQQTLEKYKGLINKELESFLDQELDSYNNDTLKQKILLLKEYVMCGGKRLRPTALIMAYNSFSDDETKIIKPSLSIELFHTFTLIFDDIMDEDDYRRGKKGIQKKLKERYLEKNKESRYDGAIFSQTSKRYSASCTMLIGLLCDMLSRKIIIDSAFDNNKKKSVLEVFNNLTKILAEGQLLDLEMELQSEITGQEYMDMIEKKTASLFIAAIEVGAIFGNAQGNMALKLKEYGKNIAVAFQIQDDIMDISANLKKGHDLGSDIKKGKRTLLVIKAVERADEKQKEILNSILGKDDAAEEEIRLVIEIFKKTGAFDYCRKLALEKINNAKKILDTMNLSAQGKDFFNGFAELMIKRIS